ncbi:MAG: hypothetical protein HUJ80_00190 [Firmicutes bacterium]|nr:hypothetical protein [Bacillota bacterium]
MRTVKYTLPEISAYRILSLAVGTKAVSPLGPYREGPEEQNEIRKMKVRVFTEGIPAEAFPSRFLTRGINIDRQGE